MRKADRSRFISEDPIGLAGGDVNLMVYVGNSPVNWIDPLGLVTGGVDLQLEGGAGVGGSVSVGVHHDDTGQVGVVVTVGGGGYGGVGGSVTLQGQSTNATNVHS